MQYFHGCMCYLIARLFPKSKTHEWPSLEWVDPKYSTSRLALQMWHSSKQKAISWWWEIWFAFSASGETTDDRLPTGHRSTLRYIVHQPGFLGRWVPTEDLWFGSHFGMLLVIAQVFHGVAAKQLSCLASSNHCNGYAKWCGRPPKL